MSQHRTLVKADLNEKTILISREFNAPVSDIWRAFTESNILDQWWGPAPWRAETKFMDFTEGGYWLYAMVGPENEKHWARMNYISIQPGQKLEIEDLFCDENGVVNEELPVSKGSMIFKSTETGTLMEFRMIYSTESQLQTIIEMGFEQGISIGFSQLDAFLERQKA